MCIDQFIEENRNFQSQIKFLKSISPIFPKVVLHYDGAEMTATTLIRKEHEGKWYLWHLVQRGIVVENQIFNRADLVERIMLNAYNILILGVVNIHCTHLSGEPVFELDPDQTPEKERLAKLLNPKL